MSVQEERGDQSESPQAKEERPSSEVERTRRLYRRLAPFYDAFRWFWGRSTRRAERSLDVLFRERIDSSTRVLELAPGTGINVERLLRMAPEFASYLGVDSSEEMLGRARQRAGGDPRIELRLGDVIERASDGGRFDFIVCTWLLSHLDEPAEMVHTAVSMLSPGGTAVFVFLTAANSRLLRATMGALGGPLHYRAVDSEPIRAFPHLERFETCAGGIATLVTFRTPPGAD